VDTYRWYALCTFNAFLALTVLKRHQSRSRADLAPIFAPNLLRNAAVLLISLNLASGSGLMDNYQVQPFPFLHLVRTWVTAARHGHLTQPAR
jgi:hypothetical protein